MERLQGPCAANPVLRLHMRQATDASPLTPKYVQVSDMPTSRQLGARACLGRIPANLECRVKVWRYRAMKQSASVLDTQVQRQSAPRHAKCYSSNRRSSNEDVAIFFSHGDAHALHARASERFLRSADVCSFPMRFNEAAAHRLKVVRNRTGRKGLPTAPSGTSYTYAAIRRSMSRRSRLKSSPSVPLGPKLEEVSCITKA